MEMTYKEFIDNILETRGRFNCGEEYHERHHIVPRCMGGSNEEENLIDLFAREHFEAHRLLALENPDVQGLTYAWWAMSVQTNKYTGERYHITAEEYEEVRIKYSEMLSKTMVGENNPNYGNHKLLGKFTGENHPSYGKPLSEEHRKKISDAMRGCKHPRYGCHWGDDIRTRLRESNGSYIICYETNEVYISSNEAEEKTGICAASIRNAKNKPSRTAGGYHWVDFEHKEEFVIKNNKRYKAVIQCDLNERILYIYELIADASKKTGIHHSAITMTCNNTRKTAGGYIWHYLYDQIRKDGTIIPGAITLGLITEEEALKMLEE